MYILGINPGWHDGSVAVLRNGEFLLLIESDRPSRVKHAMNQPLHGALRACLDEVDITLDEVEAIAIGWDLPKIDAHYDAQFNMETFKEKLIPKALFPRVREPEIEFISHHLAHAASGMWTSGYEKAAILVVDGRGELNSTTLYSGSSDTINWLTDWPISESLGNFCGYSAEWAGFTFWGAGKLMGLAPYGKPSKNSIIDTSGKHYHFIGGKETAQNISQQEEDHYLLFEKFFKNYYPYTCGSPGDVMAHANFAATVQNAFEEAMFSLVRLAKEETKADKLIIAGGAGLNCTFNGKLTQSGIFEKVYVPPVTYDTGVGLGAALVLDRQRNPSPRPQNRFDHAYWGIEPKDKAIEDAVSSSDFQSERLEDSELIPRVAAQLTEGKVIAWFQGRAEIGQRALGARSIIADPRHRQQLVKVNEVKGREIWRPLAPSLLKESAGDFFEIDQLRLADFMLSALPVRPEARPLIPTTVHVDGSARPQFVDKATNPRYWALINEFKKLTGIPVVMNTSFNLAGEPIVHTPEDAVSSFTRSSIDSLVLGNYLLCKPSNEDENSQTQGEK